MSDKIYNLRQLEELAGGSQDFVVSMVETFLEHTPSQLNDLLLAYQQKDLKTMGACAHKIKPNIDLFGIRIIYDDIRIIEKYGKTGTDAAELPALIDKVNQTLNQAFEQMRAQ